MVVIQYMYCKFRKNDLIFHHTLDNMPMQSDFKMHTHENYEIYIFLSGSGKYIIEGNEYILYPGNVIITRASESHYFKLTESVPYERMVFHFSEHNLKGFDESGKYLEPFENRNFGKLNCYSKHILDKNVLEDVIKKILKYEQEETEDLLKLETTVKLCLYELIYELKDKFLRISNEKANNENELIIKIVSYINSNITEQLTIEDIANKFYISKSYLTNKFKQVTGSTIWEYVTAKRLLLAKKMLKSGVTTQNILLNCGFSNYSTFYRRYKEFFGVTPRTDKLNLH